MAPSHLTGQRSVLRCSVCPALVTNTSGVLAQLPGERPRPMHLGHLPPHMHGGTAGADRLWRVLQIAAMPTRAPVGRRT